MTPLLLTEADACQALNLCERTLRDARKSGALPYVLIGRAVRYTLTDLETFIESRRTWASTVAKTRRSGGIASRSTVVSFEEARAKQSKALQRQSPQPARPKRNRQSRNRTDGASM